MTKMWHKQCKRIWVCFELNWTTLWFQNYHNNNKDSNSDSYPNYTSKLKLRIITWWCVCWGAIILHFHGITTIWWIWIVMSRSFVSWKHVKDWQIPMWLLFWAWKRVHGSIHFHRCFIRSHWRTCISVHRFIRN